MTTLPDDRSNFSELDEFILEQVAPSPWREFQDPLHTLQVLLELAIRWTDTSAPAARRVRDHVDRNSARILDQAFEEGQNFLWLRTQFDEKESRYRRGLLWRVLGWLGVCLGLLACVACLLAAVWLVARAVGLSRDSSFVVAVAVTVSLGTLLLASLYFVWSDLFDLGIPALAMGSVPLACIWVAVIRLESTAAGVFTGILAAAAVAVVGFGGYALRAHFGHGDEWRLQNSFDQWRAMLYNRGVLPALRNAVNTVHTDDHTTLLRLNRNQRPPEALAVIETEASEALRELAGWRNKGSFALAGPRGAGKSTLLHRWCTGEYAGRGSSVGVARTDLTVEVRAPVGYDQKEFLVYLFGRLCDAVETYVQKYDPASYEQAGRASAPFALRAQRRSPGGAAEHRHDIRDPKDLVLQARAERDRIRYLQSRVADREVAAGLSQSGLALGWKGRVSVKRDDVPMNYPELVDEFRWFIEQAARVASGEVSRGRRPVGGRGSRGEHAVADVRGSVLVGIDELDRISDGLVAQKFINELKAVFGVPNCFFLVSVSEDALTDFELSAMGMRTVFDSAFDEIVRVDYLQLAEAREMLNRLIVGLPDAFVTLAYVLSGGLARQLVRAGYQIANLGWSSEDGCPMSEVCATVVERQLRRTARAAVDRLSRAVDVTSAARLVSLLDDLPATSLTKAGMRELEGLLRAVEPERDPGAPGTSSMAGLQEEVVAMVSYLATLLEVFDDQLDGRRFATGLTPGPGHFDSLARARRYLGANPRGAEELLQAFDRVWGEGG